MSNPVQAKALSAEMQTAKDLAASLRARTRIDYGSGCEADLPNDCAAMLVSLAERIAAVEKLCDERHALAAEQFGDEIEAQYVMLDEAEIRSALKGKP